MYCDICSNQKSFINWSHHPQCNWGSAIHDLQFTILIDNGYIPDHVGYLVDHGGYPVDYGSYLEDHVGYPVDYGGYLVDYGGYLVDHGGYLFRGRF